MTVDEISEPLRSIYAEAVRSTPGDMLALLAALDAIPTPFSAEQSRFNPLLGALIPS